MEEDPSLSPTEDQGQCQEANMAITKNTIHTVETYRGIEYQGRILEIDIKGLSPRTT